MNATLRFLSAYALIFVTSHVVASDFSDRNGNWWNSRSKVEKAIYTLGMIDGVDTAGAMLTQKGRTVSDNFEGDVARLFGKTQVQQFIEGMNRFYSDFRNRGISTSDALWLVALQISGVPDEEMHRLTVSERRAHSEASAIELKMQKEKISRP